MPKSSAGNSGRRGSQDKRDANDSSSTTAAERRDATKAGGARASIVEDPEHTVYIDGSEKRRDAVRAVGGSSVGSHDSHSEDDYDDEEDDFGGSHSVVSAVQVEGIVELEPSETGTKCSSTVSGLYEASRSSTGTLISSEGTNNTQDKDKETNAAQSSSTVRVPFIRRAPFASAHVPESANDAAYFLSGGSRLHIEIAAAERKEQLLLDDMVHLVDTVFHGPDDDALARLTDLFDSKDRQLALTIERLQAVEKAMMAEKRRSLGLEREMQGLNAQLAEMRSDEVLLLIRRQATEILRNDLMRQIREKIAASKIRDEVEDIILWSKQSLTMPTTGGSSGKIVGEGSQAGLAPPSSDWRGTSGVLESIPHVTSINIPSFDSRASVGLAPSNGRRGNGTTDPYRPASLQDPLQRDVLRAIQQGVIKNIGVAKRCVASLRETAAEFDAMWKGEVQKLAVLPALVIKAMQVGSNNEDYKRLIRSNFSLLESAAKDGLEGAHEPIVKGCTTYGECTKTASKITRMVLGKIKGQQRNISELTAELAVAQGKYSATSGEIDSSRDAAFNAKIHCLALETDVLDVIVDQLAEVPVQQQKGAFQSTLQSFYAQHDQVKKLFGSPSVLVPSNEKGIAAARGTRINMLNSLTEIIKTELNNFAVTGPLRSAIKVKVRSASSILARMQDFPFSRIDQYGYGTDQLTGHVAGGERRAVGGDGTSEKQNTEEGILGIPSAMAAGSKASKVRHPDSGTSSPPPAPTMAAVADISFQGEPAAPVHQQVFKHLTVLKSMQKDAFGQPLVNPRDAASHVSPPKRVGVNSKTSPTGDRASLRRRDLSPRKTHKALPVTTAGNHSAVPSEQGATCGKATCDPGTLGGDAGHRRSGSISGQDVDGANRQPGALRTTSDGRALLVNDGRQHAYSEPPSKGGPVQREAFAAFIARQREAQFYEPVAEVGQEEQQQQDHHGTSSGAGGGGPLPPLRKGPDNGRNTTTSNPMDLAHGGVGRVVPSDSVAERTKLVESSGGLLRMTKPKGRTVGPL